jgi:hypothetical protein
VDVRSADEEDEAEDDERDESGTTEIEPL